MSASDGDDKYLMLLRRELVRAQARLTRAERERDRLFEENRRLLALLADHGIEPPPLSPEPDKA
jgi:hypothetical protein